MAGESPIQLPMAIQDARVLTSCPTEGTTY